MSSKQKSLFTISILLNIILIGMIAAFYFCSPAFIWHAGPGAPHMAGLSPEARKMVRESFHSAGDDMRDKFREARDAREELVKILSSPAFDQKAYDAASRHMNGVKQDIGAAKAKVTRDLAMKLPAADRQKMARNLAGLDKGTPPWMGEGPKRGDKAGKPAKSAP